VVREPRLRPARARGGCLPADARAALLQQLLPDRPPAGDRARQAVVDLSPPQFNRVFFTGSGLGAATTPWVRLVRRYWTYRASRSASHSISRVNAYHGSTMAGASLGGMAFMHEQGGLPIPTSSTSRSRTGTARAATCRRDEFGSARAGAGGEDPRARRGRVAAFIGEPIQRGAAGVIIPPDRLLARDPARSATVHGILLPWRTSDPAASAGPATGSASDSTASARPDDGRQGAVLGLPADRRACWSPTGSPTRAYRQGRRVRPRLHLFGAPGGLRRGERHLTLIQQENLVARTRTRWGRNLAAKWRQLAAHPLVGEARSVG